MANWVKGILEIEEGNNLYMSVVFSWDVIEAIEKAEYYRMIGKNVIVGGPAVYFNIEKFQGVAEIGYNKNMLQHYNPDACFTSRGCIRKCGFCAVPKIEGDLVELKEWIPKPIICDNNLLACSRKHFDKVIDSLKPLKGIDFNQGLDARLLNKYHAERMAELKLDYVRLAWDNIKNESEFMRSWQILRKAGIPKSKISVYVLIGFNDTPEDALYRLKTISELGGKTMPMRYQPLNTMKKNAYVGGNWTSGLLNKYMRYWSNFRFFKQIPFNEYDHTTKKNDIAKEQKELF